MDDMHIDNTDSCFVEVAYQCPGQPLDVDMEGELEFVAGDCGGSIGARLDGETRIVTFWFHRRTDADKFVDYVRSHYPATDACLVIDWADET
jgi:hypothetical protein